jgi:galactokinase
VTENRRVREVARALREVRLDEAGALLSQSHRSLRDDFEVSTPALDALVERLARTPGVHGARLTGAGFGGCVVALAEPGALREGWVVQASAGARVVR